MVGLGIGVDAGVRKEEEAVRASSLGPEGVIAPLELVPVRGGSSSVPRHGHGLPLSPEFAQEPASDHHLSELWGHQPQDQRSGG